MRQNKTNASNLICKTIQTEHAERRCDADGYWMVRPGFDRKKYPNGWTNFTPCYTEEMRKLLEGLYADGSEETAKVSFDTLKFDAILSRLTFGLISCFR